MWWSVLSFIHFLFFMITHFDNYFFTDDDKLCQTDYYVTIEDRELFSQCFPHFVVEFDQQAALKKSKGLFMSYEFQYQHVVNYMYYMFNIKGKLQSVEQLL